MITFTKSYKTSDGQVFGTIEQAQLHELQNALLNITIPPAFGSGSGVTITESVAREILKKKDIIIDVLTTTQNSKPKARSVNGGTKKRKLVITDADTSIRPSNSDSDNK